MSTQNRFRYAESVEGVDVEKRYDETEFPFPSVVYDFVSTRTEPVALSVEDVLPEAVDAENVGFHADYNGDDWAVDGDRLRFERELPPESECRTIYAISATQTEEPREIFVEPSTIDVTPPAADGADPEAEGLDLADPEGPGSTTDGSGTDPATNGTAGTSAGDDGALLSTLASEMTADDVDRGDLDTVAAAVADAMDDAAGSVDARLSSLESDVAELRAYGDAMADFLDENGGEPAAPEAFERRVSTLESDLEAVRTQTDDLGSEVGSVRAETGTLDADVDAVSDSLDELSTEVEALRAALGGTAEGPPVTDRVATLEDRLAEFEDFVEDVRAAFE